MNRRPCPRRRETADKSGPLQTLRARDGVSGSRVSVWSACVFSAAFPRQQKPASWALHTQAASCRFLLFGRMAVPLGFFLGRCDLLVIVGKYLVPRAVAMEGG